MSLIALVGIVFLVLQPSVVDSMILPLVAFAAGSLVGGALFHMIPHAVEDMGNSTELYVWLAAGFVLFLGLEQFLNWHHSHTHSHSCGPWAGTHQHAPCPPCTRSTKNESLRIPSETHAGGLDCHVIQVDHIKAFKGDQSAVLQSSQRGGDDDDVEGVHDTATNDGACDSRDSLHPDAHTSDNQSYSNEEKERFHQRQSLAYLILIADAVHNFLGGLFVGASFVDSTRLGISAWSAAAFHEVPQELGDFAILVHGGWSKPRALLFNFLSALTFPLGGIVAYLSSQSNDISFLIPFAAGNFLYIGATDLIPEIKHYHGLATNALHFMSFLSGLLILLVIRIALDGW